MEYKPMYDGSAFHAELKHRLNAMIVCLSHSWGGLEQVAASDALQLKALGLKIRVLVLAGSPIHEYLRKRNLNESEKSWIEAIDYRPRNLLDLKLRQDIQRWTESEGINLFHLHQTTLLNSFSPWLWRHRKVVLIATRHILNSHNKKNLFHYLIYRRVDALLVISRSVKLNVLYTHPIREKRVRLVNLGLDFEVFDPAKVRAEEQRQSWGAAPGTMVIGTVGRIDPAKGQSTLIKAVAGLMKDPELSGRVKVVIVGEETLGSTAEHLQELKEMVRVFHLEDCVVFAGYQENIPEIMRSFDIFVMPSKQEAFGLVAIEAMAMGCPIIISSGGSAQEIVGEDEEFGMTMRPGDAFDLQRQLRYLIDHPEERKDLAARAREHVAQNYDQRARLFRTLEVYLDQLEAKK